MEVWWYSSEVQTVWEIFCRKYAHRVKDIIPKLAAVIKEAFICNRIWEYFEDTSGGESFGSAINFDSPGVLIDKTVTSTTSGTLIVNITSSLETYADVRLKLVFQVYKNGAPHFNGDGKNILVDSESTNPKFHRGCITSYIPEIDNNDTIQFKVTLVFLTNASGHLYFGSGGNHVSSGSTNAPPRKHIVINSAII